MYTRNSPQSTESDGNSGGLMDQHIFAPLPISKVAAESVEIAILYSLKHSFQKGWLTQNFTSM